MPLHSLLKTSVYALALSAVFVSPFATALETASAGAIASPGAPLQPVTWKNVPTQSVAADGVDFAFRELGQQHGGTPVVLLAHLAAVLDNWDPRVVDGLAAKRHVIAFDNRGVGASTGKPANTIEQMADDAVSFIKARGFKQVDLFGFSMGGMVLRRSSC